MSIIETALARQARIPDGRIDYDRMNKAYPKQKAALTRAIKSGDPERIAKVCAAAVREWDDIGAWPDGWALWESALNDAIWPKYISLHELRGLS